MGTDDRERFADVVQQIGEHMLTSRQLECAYLATVEGLNTLETAHRMTVEPKTIDAHWHNTAARLLGYHDDHGVRSVRRMILVAYWKRVGADELRGHSY